MNNILWGDLESYYENPINNGIHAYAEGVEVMLFALAICPSSWHLLRTAITMRRKRMFLQGINWMYKMIEKATNLLAVTN